MKKLLAMCCTVAGITSLLAAQTTQPFRQGEIRFATVDVFIDSGDAALAAYQFELAAETGNFAIVGIEGGGHAAFAEPPYYDPAALSHDRVIVAAFNTGQDLPKRRIRVARLHVQIHGRQDPDYAVKLHVCASNKGEPIPATVTVKQGAAR